MTKNVVVWAIMDMESAKSDLNVYFVLENDRKKCIDPLYMGPG